MVPHYCICNPMLSVTYMYTETQRSISFSGLFCRCRQSKASITVKAGILIILLLQHSMKPFTSVPNGPLIIMQYATTSSTGLTLSAEMIAVLCCTE